MKGEFMNKYKSNKIISSFLLLATFFGMLFMANINSKADSSYAIPNREVNRVKTPAENKNTVNNRIHNNNVKNNNNVNKSNNKRAVKNNKRNYNRTKRVNPYWNRWHRRGYVDLRPRMKYVSQVKPRYIADACEAASLKMALSIKGKAHHVSLRRMLKRIGWQHHGNPNYEYSNNPYIRDGASIYPREIVRVAKWYGAKAKVASHSSKHKLIHYLQKKDPIVIEAGHKMRMTSDHVVCLIGYRHARHSSLSEFEYADPENFGANPIIRWINTNWFMKVYDRPVTGRRAAVIL